MYSDIFVPALILGIIALALGVMLAIASAIFRSEKSQHQIKIEECLSGANCGGCGYTGCGAYASAIVNDNAPIDLCGAGGASVQNAIADILGIERTEFIPRKAVVNCQGTCDNSVLKYDYIGTKSCRASAVVGGGPKLCTFGCLGFGNCMDVCENGAISIINNVARVNEKLCTGCGACVKTCPRGLITLKNEKNRIYISCKSLDRGSAVRKYCSVGCVACGLCIKVCEHDAIHLDGNLPVIDYDKCTDCGMCAEKCPAKCIVS